MGHKVSQKTRDKLAKHNRAEWEVHTKDGGVTVVSDLRQFAKNNGLRYHSLCKTGNPKEDTNWHKGYKAIKIEKGQ